jgi:O-antigen ligase
MAHNDYLHFIAETGLPLIPLLAWLAYRFFRRGFYLAGRKDRWADGTAPGVMAAAVAVMIHGLGDFNLHIPANALIFTVLCASMEISLPDAGEPQ